MTFTALRCSLMSVSALMLAAAVAGDALAPTAGAGPLPAAVRAERDRADELFDPGRLARSLCGPAGRERGLFFRPGLLLAAAGQDRAAEPPDPPLWNSLGELGYPITTASREAQRYFDQGLRLSYAFNHQAAIRSFRRAQALDPSCAMCYWGEAWALGPNINAAMPAEAVEPAFAAVAKALALAGGAGERERALIGALARRYSPDPNADRTALNTVYASAMATVAAGFPTDTTIATLYADAVMNVSPWDYWAADGRTPKGQIGTAIKAVERALARNPDHTFAIHLYIHLVEASTTPERAEPHADRLAATMPGAGHIIHMPSHIYFRLGRHLDALASNMAAVAVDEFYIEQAGAAAGDYAYSYYPHNVHFLLESARMAGDGETALAAADKLPRAMSDEVARALPWVEIIKAAPYFAHAQFSPPATALAVPAPGDGFPYVTAMWHYMRGVTAAAAGDTAGAQAEADAIARIRAATDWTHMTGGGVPAPDLLQLAGHVVAGRIAQAEGRHDAAVGAFEQAVAIQDTLPYLEPPYWYYPVRQSLGAALLQAGRAEAAARVFQESLIRLPNNAWALYGLRESQQAQGDEAAAARTADLLDRAWAGEEMRLELGRL